MNFVLINKKIRKNLPNIWTPNQTNHPFYPSEMGKVGPKALATKYWGKWLVDVCSNTNWFIQPKVWPPFPPHLKWLKSDWNPKSLQICLNHQPIKNHIFLPKIWTTYPQHPFHPSKMVKVVETAKSFRSLKNKKKNDQKLWTPTPSKWFHSLWNG